ncbi:hypothetical protein A1Q1_04187 [Trichosporon asahii var. asahii CBS 2479]|uniref:Pre-mRNA polyadenylation factor Fip1 domain-containing protein n=1 Tax=Trichosporon asahii var. asahii (strain ATCC 90039 / CBS 2479 / JCM 2466 / KCTC 7840 / NBRC 103889/ NCYC 2677 / UAMH 7654) TaxID=1186058 RepID=J6EW91_TRIAS|nr:hypothetical protein A1Q1_04187 [Trichosporon asahii var. asahii CBS 2479]EJT47067.1 hypothetical protein A1Q1_04187 [Trichosporon asahii var. asahii CBS 2479]
MLPAHRHFASVITSCVTHFKENPPFTNSQQAIHEPLRAKHQTATPHLHPHQLDDTMDMDDDDAFLYGDEPAPAPAQAAAPAADVAPAAADCASLAAYGIDPSTAVAEEPLEDGGVEEEDEDDSESDSDEDDIKLDMTTGPQRVLDLRKKQTQSTANVYGIGKWAKASTGIAAKPAAEPANTASSAPPAASPAKHYTPTERPGVAQPAASAAAATPAADASPAQPVAGNGPPPTTALPHSTLAVQTIPATDPKIDGSQPTGIIPSTGTSVYDVDVAQFEGSGQIWRRPGSDLSDWFNYGFDEVTYPKYLRYRQDMEQGRVALAGMPGMGPLPPQVAQLLHLQQQGAGDMNPQLQQMQMQQQMQQMQQQMMMGGMDPAMMFAMQNQGMAGMMGGGMQPQLQQADQDNSVDDDDKVS